MSPPQPARPLYLTETTEGVFALFHDACDRRGGTAVLLCPPFGWDPMCPYCQLLRLGEHLAARGFPSLQIDLPGSGDSACNPDDPGRLEAWTQAVAAAATWLHAASDAVRIAAVGIGLGGLLAYRAVSERAPIDDLVLWGVPARGATLVRELRVGSRLPSSSLVEPGGGDPRPLPEGAVMAAGYLLSAPTASSLEALDLSQLALPDGAGRRALLLGRNGPTVDDLLRSCLERAQVEVTVASGRGHGAKSEALARVDPWLAQGEADRRRRHAPVQPAPSRTTPSAAFRTPSSHEHLALDCAGARLRETPVCVDRPGGRLLGVLTEPVGRRAQLCAVLLAGHHRRIGPNRMWVEIARRWAARGVPTLRIDLSPVVDSEEDASADAGTRFAPEYVEETCAALEMLDARGLPPRFVLGGLAAGAYWSMQAALRDERIAAIVMLNPRALIWNEQIQATRDARRLRRRSQQRSPLRHVLAGELAPRRLVEASLSLAPRAVRHSLDRSLRIARSWRTSDSRPDPLEGALDRLRDRDQRGLLLFTGKEPLREELATAGLLDRLDHWPNLELAIIDTPVETLMLTPLWVQRRVHEIVDGVLDRELARVSEQAL
jgi:pimeloyl-ACP methyl ester carboxylesterase